MRFTARRSLVWPATILAGLALGGSVLAAWPDAAPPTVPPQASVDVNSGRELVGAVHPGAIFVYELPSTMLVDSITATPQRVDAH